MSDGTPPMETVRDGHLTDEYLNWAKDEYEIGFDNRERTFALIPILIDYIFALKNMIWVQWSCPKCRTKLTQEQKTVGMWHCPSCRITVMESMR
jgi:hypothetical protein